MKVFNLSIIVSAVVLSFNAAAQELSPAQLRQAIKDEFNSPQNQKILLETFNAADVNKDGFISENEFALMLKSISTEPLTSAADKAAKKARWQQRFKQEDKNYDRRLNKTEYAYFMYHEVEQETLAMFEKAKVMATKTPEEMTQELAKARIEAEKLKALPSNDVANKMFAAASDNLASQNYFQMDKNKDGCVTESEYADYMFVYTQNANNEDEYKMSKDDWKELYKTSEEKLKANCLTKAEYIRNFNKLLVSSGAYFEPKE